MKIVKYRNEVIVSNHSIPKINYLVKMGEENTIPHAWMTYGSEQNLFITELFIPEKDRGQGFAKDLINFIITMSKKTGIKTIELSPSDCFGSDLVRLKKFYKSFGFEESGTLMRLHI